LVQKQSKQSAVDVSSLEIRKEHKGVAQLKNGIHSGNPMGMPKPIPPVSSAAELNITPEAVCYMQKIEVSLTVGMKSSC